MGSNPGVIEGTKNGTYEKSIENILIKKETVRSAEKNTTESLL